MVAAAYPAIKINRTLDTWVGAELNRRLECGKCSLPRGCERKGQVSSLISPDSGGSPIVQPGLRRLSNAVKCSDLHRTSLLRAFSDVSWNQCFGLQNHQVVLPQTKNHSK